MNWIKSIFPNVRKNTFQQPTKQFKVPLGDLGGLIPTFLFPSNASSRIGKNRGLQGELFTLPDNRRTIYHPKNYIHPYRTTEQIFVWHRRFVNVKYFLGNRLLFDVCELAVLDFFILWFKGVRHGKTHKGIRTLFNRGLA